MNKPLLQFIETLVFRKRLDKLTDLSTLFAIQADLLENPRLGDVIKDAAAQEKHESRTGRVVAGKVVHFVTFIFTSKRLR